MPRWIQHPITHELIPADEYEPPRQNQSAYIHGDIDSFVSPVDRTVISDRSHLRNHNRKHGVTDMRDYGPEYFKRKAKERQSALRGDSSEARSERKRDLLRTIEQLKK